MRQGYILTILLTLCLQSCDFVRIRLGMPSSIDIQEYRESLRQIYNDSLRLDSIRRFNELDSIRNVHDTTLSETYFVVIGSFTNRDNLDRMAELIMKKGFHPGIFEFKNGNIVLVAASYNDIKEAYVIRNILSVTDERLEATWIYNIKDELHKKYNRRYEPDKNNSIYSETH